MLAKHAKELWTEKEKPVMVGYYGKSQGKQTLGLVLF